MSQAAGRRSLRYVALGDSLSEGIGDTPLPGGTPRGWTDRLAALLADHHGGIEYSNLAVRGSTASKVRDTQLAAAIDLEPDLVTVTAGMNDLLRPRFDLDDLRATLAALVSSFTRTRARVLVVPIPDIRRLSPMGWLVHTRRERLNEIYSDLGRLYGVLDLPLGPNEGETVFQDPRAWAADHLHLSPLGHERLALAAASTLGLPLSGDPFVSPEGVVPGRSLTGDLAWWGRFVVPWLGRRLTGRSSGDGREPKRPSPTFLPSTVGSGEESARS